MKFKKEKPTTKASADELQKNEKALEEVSDNEKAEETTEKAPDVAEENTEVAEKKTDGTEENTDKKSAPAEKKRLPLFSKIMLGIAAVSLVFYVIFLNSPAVSDFFNKYVSSVIRAILSYLTTWIPFSLAEMLVILIPVIIVLIVGIGIKKYSSSWRNVAVFCVIMLSIASYIFSTFVFGFVPAYHGSTLDKKMGLEKKDVTAQELYDTAQILSAELSKESEYIIYNGKGMSVMPYGYGELNDKLMDAYEKATEKYDFISPLHSKVKRIMLSEPMTYTHISGVYTFFTGEANINVNFNDYILPFTAAHELAHQRGIARENEVNFVAFLVCMESDDHYIRYSAYLNLYEYVTNALYSVDQSRYAKAVSALPDGAKSDIIAHIKSFKKYEESAVGKFSEAVNDTFLNLNGVEEGSKSYGMVVDLAVAYYKKAS